MTWDSQYKELTSEPFQEAISAGMEKINEYYEKTAESDAHIMAMREFFSIIPLKMYAVLYIYFIVLHPKRKMKYFKKNWSSELQLEVLTLAEKIVRNLNL